MSALDPATRQAVWDLAEQLADRPETITVSVDIDRWGRRKVTADIHARNGLDECRALLRSVGAANIQEVSYEGTVWLRGVVTVSEPHQPDVHVPVHVVAVGEQS